MKFQKKILTILFFGIIYLLTAADGRLDKRTNKTFYTEKKEPHFVLFREVRNDKVPMYQENSKASETVKLLRTRDFVEIVDGKLGLTLTKIKSFDKDAGYVEGYTKNDFLNTTDYYSEPYALSEAEIMKIKEAEEQRRLFLAEQEKKRQDLIKENKFKNVITSARNDAKIVLGLSYSELSAYLDEVKPVIAKKVKKGKKTKVEEAVKSNRLVFKEDAAYAEKATKTIRFENSSNADLSLYFTMKDKAVTGILLSDSQNGIEIDKADILLYELAGEIFYNIEETVKINDFITKEIGTLEKSGYKIIVKKDASKENRILEITIGDFSGVE